MSHLSMSLEWSFPLRTFLLDVEIPNVASCNSKLVVGPGTLDSCFNQASHGFIKKISIVMCFSNFSTSAARPKVQLKPAQRHKTGQCFCFRLVNKRLFQFSVKVEANSSVIAQPAEQKVSRASTLYIVTLPQFHLNWVALFACYNLKNLYTRCLNYTLPESET